MGIQGLKAYLKAKLMGVFSPTILPLNSTLCIDGNGWLFDLVDRLPDFYADYGGCYLNFEQHVIKEVQFLRNLKLKLKVFFDGPIRRMKSKTDSKRDEEHKEKWRLFQSYCEEEYQISKDYSFPLPSLAKNQFIHTLKLCGVELVFCKEEADQEIAKYVVKHNTGNNAKHFIYGKDSDYFAMKDAPYIECGTITEVIDKNTSHAQAETIWRRSDICEALGLSEDQYIDWLILIGNDYSKQSNRCTSYNMNIDKKYQLKMGENALNYLLLAIYEHYEADPEFRLTAKEQLTPHPSDDSDDDECSSSVWKVVSNNEIEEVGSDNSFVLIPSSVLEIQKAIDFSRALYNLIPIDIFDIDEDDDDDDTALQCFTGHIPDLSSDVDKYIAMLRSNENNMKKKLGITEHAISYFRWIAAQQNNKTADTMTTSTTELHNNTQSHYHDLHNNTQSHYHDVLSSHLLIAFEKMSKEIYQIVVEAEKKRGSIDGNLYISLPENQVLARPLWNNVVASCIFQRTCYYLYKKLDSSMYPSKYRSPKSWYDGLIFHKYAALITSNKQSFDTEVQLIKDQINPKSNSKSKMNKSSDHIESSIAQDASSSSIQSNVANTTTPLQNIKTALKILKTSNSSTSITQTSTATATTAVTKTTTVSDVLPIDAFRDEIINRIVRDRVTIIHGETGCGKSSCLPRFLLEHAEANRQHCKITVSQPRRIAVTSLLRRLRETLGDKVGMRMGHGVKDETENTKISFVTTGYLVRLLAHHPNSFDYYTHLVIDEVHERSVDGDLICLLARNLLKTHPTIRIILMSATVHTSLYKNYFEEFNDGSYGEMECLSVGVRRFPVDILFAEDIINFSEKISQTSRLDSKHKALAPMIHSSCQDIVKLTHITAQSDVPQKLAAAQYKAAFNLVRAVGVEGTGVLIFVSGINDITEIVQLFEDYPKFLVFPIHSDIPPEEQELAFGVTPEDKIKVVVATNAAESSVTIPDCDVVICLGTHKALQYSSLNHRTQLVNTWISKASATQRAGRTGRVRPGTVYRLYSKKLYDTFSDHEVAEVHRRPLQDVLLSMWVMLEDSADFHGVTPFLQGLIEAPDMNNIEQSYQYLYESDLITEPNDEGFLTAIGKLSGELPVDIALGRMIAFGIILGVAAEAVVLAAALSLPKSPFRYANSMYCDPEEFNSIIRTKFMTALEFDEGTYSEPIMYLRLLQKWRTLPLYQIGPYCHKMGLNQVVMKQFRSMSDHLAHTVNSRLKPKSHHSRTLPSKVKESVEMEEECIDLGNMKPLDENTINLLRLILLWSSSGNLLRMQDMTKAGKIKDTDILVQSKELTDQHLKTILDPVNIPYEYKISGRRIYNKKIQYWVPEDFFPSLEILLGHMATTSISVSAQCYWIFIKCSKNNNLLLIGIPDGNNQEETLESLLENVFPKDNKLFQKNNLSDLINNIQSKYHSQLFIVENITSKEIKRLNDFRDYLNITLSILIPLNENANLTAYNCIPTYHDLILIFTNTEYNDLIDEKIDIPVQISHSTAMISFPKFSNKNNLEFMSNNQDKKSRKSNKNFDNSRQDHINEQHTMQNEEMSSLIEDLPIGHRILNCCQQQIGKQRSKYLIVSDTITASSLSLNTNSNKKALLPGSAEYAEAQLLKSILKVDSNQDLITPMKNNSNNNSNNNNSGSSGKLEIKMNCISPSWVNIRNIKTTPSSNNKEDEPNLKNINAVLSRQSMLSCSYHLGEETVFAITHTALVLGMNADIVACDGITFLPPGAKWLFLALTCTGADGNQIGNYVNNNTSIEIEEEDYMLACKISELLTKATHVLPRNDIINYINQLFIPYDHNNISSSYKNSTTKKLKNKKGIPFDSKNNTNDIHMMDLITLMNDLEMPLIVEQYNNKHEKAVDNKEMNLYNTGEDSNNHQNKNMNKKSNKAFNNKTLTPSQVWNSKEKKNSKK